MNEKALARICIIITLFGVGLLLFSYKPEFEEKNINYFLSSEGEVKGIVFGRIEHVMKNEPTTLFVLNDGNKINVYLPKESNLKKNDFVQVYGIGQEYNGKKEIYAYKVRVEE